jgi:hypothetical protein
MVAVEDMTRQPSPQVTFKKRHSLVARWELQRATLAWGLALGLGYSAGCGSSANPSGVGATGNQGDDGGSSQENMDDASSSGSSSGSASSSGSGASGSGSSGGQVDAGHPDAGQMDATEPEDSGIVGAGDAGGVCPAPSGITSQQTTALQIVNQTRAAMGSPCATMVAALNTSSTKHCAYYAANASNMTCVADPHTEVSGCTDFVAADFGTRETDAGYTGQPSSEVMAFDDNPTSALGQWLDSVYHRSPLLDPWTRDLGYGNGAGCDTMDFGVGAMASANLVVAYPYDGQTGVVTSFNGALEGPTPPVPPNGWPSGVPIHVFMQATSITLTTDEFGVDGGAQLAHQELMPQTSSGYLQNALVLYGNAPLAAQTTYRVHVAGTRQTQSFTGTSSSSFDVNFTFTTQ